jgi:lipoprotein-anchoring transpeptidase ErfK/SrfK
MVRTLLRMVVGAFVAGATSAARARDVVAFPAGAAPGTIIVKTSERRLYFVIGDGIALRYPIAVGRAARQWFGHVSITGKHLQPAWSPPSDLRRENPDVPDVIPGGAPNNPMGVAALTLSGGDYAIGTFASYGCIRMYNEDIAHLFTRVNVGTPVVVAR